MDPKTLFDTSLTTALPAPVWFIELFKWLGFSLHEVPMNLWYAGLVVAMLLFAMGSDHGQRFAARLMAQMPIIIAMGINLGIVPLLFIQVGFYQIFYPATILMAWFWLAVVVLLIPAYYGVYLYSLGLAEQGPAMPSWKRAVGWLAAVLFLTIGFLFANALSLMENVGHWPDLWLGHSQNGAVLGTALNLADFRFWPRWLLMFGLALGTTGVWVAFDAAWFATRESHAYKLWAKQFAWKLYTLGFAWFLIAGAWYCFGTWPTETRQTMFGGPWILLSILTIAIPALPWWLLWSARRRDGEIHRFWASLLGLAQFGVLGINAASRQVVQHLEIGPYFDITAQTTEPQWGPMAIFLVSFVLGLGLVAWMIYQVAKLPPKPDGA